MSFLEKKNQTSPDSPLNKRRASWSPLKNVALALKLQAFATPNSKTKTLISDFSKIDRTRRLSDETLLRILSKLPDSQRNPNCLVCKRWLYLQGRLVRSLKVTAWEFLESGRLISRFPNLYNVDLVRGCLNRQQNSGILVNHKMFALNIDPRFSSKWCFIADNLLPTGMIDRGIRTVASGCPNLRKLVLINASELGLLSVAEECLTLQELELHKCNDNILIGISACENLRILRLVANLDGFYNSIVSDIGLTIVAQGCKRLVKLELVGCEGSFHGIKALGQCCQMLEELLICDHRMEPGWLGALQYCQNLKTLRFVSCKQIDPSPGPDVWLGACPALEQLHLQKCQLRDKRNVKTLFQVCEAVREVVFQDCWGLNDEVFCLASAFRRVKFLSLEGCSLLTTAGLESVILQWQGLERLKVLSCKSVKDIEISDSLSALFSTLIELQWRPDTRSHLASGLSGTGIGKKGRKLFKKM